MTASLFLGAYHFDGDPPELLRAHDRLMAGFPAGEIDLHVCVEREGGITVFDACPSREVFAAFSTSGEFLSALTAAGLPAPRVEPLGAVRTTIVREVTTP